VCDPSHVAGTRARVAEVAQQALDLNFSGLMVETHRDPAHALSDAEQQLDPAGLGGLLASLIFRQPGADAIAGDRLEQLRDLIDQLDEEIIQKLGARMDIAERIGEHKHEHNVAILQPERWERIMRRQLRLGTGLGLDPAFIEAFMNAIHQESIRRQGSVWNAAPEDGTGERSGTQG